MRKRIMVTLLSLAMLISMLAGCGSAKPASTDEKSGEVASTDDAKSEPTEMVIMIENADLEASIEAVKMLTEDFSEVNLISKPFDQAQIEKTVKSAFAAGEAIDIVRYWPNQMRNFTSSDMALDLTPYLEADPAWKDSFTEGTLEVGNFDGKYVAVPYGTVYPVLQVNKALLEQAGVEIKEQWTWEEFVAACQAIDEKTDAFPLGIKGDDACWFVRNGLMQVWDNQAELDSFNAGEIPFTDPRVKEVFEKTATLFNNNYVYPGESALTMTLEQVIAAFAKGEVAMFANANSRGALARDAVDGAFEIQILSWPNMGNPDLDFILGGSNGFFITSNTKNPDKAVEMLKALTGVAIMQKYADNGAIVPIKGIESKDPDYGLYGVDAAKVYPSEPINISPELFDYIVYNSPANYIFYGDASIDELEALRVAAIGE